MSNWLFELGDTVYLRTDPEQLERLVTERKEQIGGTTLYGLSTELVFSYHYGIEIELEFNELKALGLSEKEAN